MQGAVRPPQREMPRSYRYDAALASRGAGPIG